jgi:hypothetical protein
MFHVKHRRCLNLLRLFLGRTAPAGFYTAAKAFGKKPLFPGSPGWQSRPALFGEPGGSADKRFRPGVGLFKVYLLGTFLAGRKDKRFLFPGTGEPGLKTFPESRGLRRVKTGQVFQNKAQSYLGVYFIDVLAPRPSGSGKNNFCRIADGLTK